MHQTKRHMRSMTGAVLTCAAMLLAAVALGTGNRWWSEVTPGDAEAEAAASERRRDSPGEAMEWRLRSLQDENGIIAEGGLMRARAQANRMRRVPFGAGIGRGTWTPVGPGNIGGRIRAMVIHPTTPATIVIGAASGGIWRTTDAGATWAPMQDFMANLAVTSIVMRPGTTGGNVCGHR